MATGVGSDLMASGRGLGSGASCHDGGPPRLWIPIEVARGNGLGLRSREIAGQVLDSTARVLSGQGSYDADLVGRRVPDHPCRHRKHCAVGEDNPFAARDLGKREDIALPDAGAWCAAGGERKPLSILQHPSPHQQVNDGGRSGAAVRDHNVVVTRAEIRRPISPSPR